MKKGSIVRVIGAGIVFAAMSQIIHSLGAILTMDFYTDPNYFQVWSKIMMPGKGPPPTYFFYYSVVFGIITGILLALVYVILHEGVPGKGFKKGIAYGLLIFFVSGITGSLSMYLLINLPSVLIAYWAMENLFVLLIGGVAFQRLLG